MESIAKQFENYVLPQTNAIAEKIVELQYQLQPEFWKPYGSKGRMLSVRDAGYHLPFLTESILAGDPDIFTAYVAWVKILFRGLKFPDKAMIVNLECTKKILKEFLPEPLKLLADTFIDAGIETMDKDIPEPKGFIDTSNNSGKLAQNYIDFLLKGDRQSANKLIMDAFAGGVPIKTLYLEVFQNSQYEIGRLWLSNQISVATEHFCSAATQSLISQLYPNIFSGKRIGRTLVAACVGGELHEIGIRMVADFFEMEGWDTYYLGANSPSGAIIKAIEEKKADLVGLSAAMPYHRALLRDTISQIRSSQKGKNIKIMIGGNAVNFKSEHWSDFGADGYAPDAAKAIETAKLLIMD